MRRFGNYILVLFLVSSCKQNITPPEAINPSQTLWYNKPSSGWNEALPVGNGRIGGMVYGGLENDTIQFNEETLWTGRPHEYAHKDAYKYFGKLRHLLWSGKQEEAQELGNAHFMSQPFGQQAYQPFGDVLLTFPGHGKAVNYQRSLDLEKAISSVFYEVDGVTFKREVFSSFPGQAMVIHVEAGKNGALNFVAGLDCPHNDYDIKVKGNEIILKGKANNYPQALGRDGKPYPESKLTFEARLKVINDGGEMVEKGQSVKVENAREATLYLVAATSFVNYHDISANPAERCKAALKNLEGKSYETLKAEHINDYQQLFNRVSIDLGSSEISMRPTNERLISFKTDEDPSLVALLYQYGRYLLISSSRPGTQPANLQGIWNDKLAPPWDSKYTININTEMNYWPAEITNLSECTAPLIQMVKDLSVTGQNVAREHYNMDGWVTHHNTDLWRGSAPINNANHGIWVSGGSWLSEHLWWHYQFTGDKNYLGNTAYPILKEASRFFSEYLVRDPKHPEWLVSGPGNSPELGGLVMGPTMDHQIIRNLFSNTIESAGILGVDTDFAKMLKAKRDSIAPNQIGQYGQLQEWLDDGDDPNNKHRHVSHLWGLHPGNEIHPLTTPKLADACRVTLSQRGDGGAGWSRAWKINFWVRLLDGDHAFQLIKNLIVPSIVYDRYTPDGGGLYMNLLDACPPFQIDGNFGATSGITEMLLQSHLRDNNGDYYQDILPALPSKLASGKISGIKGRGGFEFTIAWNNGELVSAKVKSLLGNRCIVRYKGKEVEINLEKGESQEITF
jgi:alpha-L-fucosidase 2